MASACRARRPRLCLGAARRRVRAGRPSWADRCHSRGASGGVWLVLSSDEVAAFISQPAIAALLWLGLAAVTRRILSPRTRIASLSPLAGVFAVGLTPAFSALANFGSSIFVGLVEAALLMADLTLFFGPVVVAVARVLRGPLGGLSDWRPAVAYL